MEALPGAAQWFDPRRRLTCAGWRAGDNRSAITTDEMLSMVSGVPWGVDPLTTTCERGTVLFPNGVGWGELTDETRGGGCRVPVRLRVHHAGGAHRAGG
eukprot:COSAG01_NODE_8142_length_2904_cov_2.717848_3_plen_99_part_00